jgi:hypothetical protein
MTSFVKNTLARAVHNQACRNALEATLFKLSQFLEREKYRNENSPPPPVLNLDAALKIISPA